MKLIFIRHGETTGDVENRYGGNYNDHLTDRGREQATAAREELKVKNIDLIISSPFIRAQESAEILADNKCPIIIEPDFRERNQYGILTGRIKEEAAIERSDLTELLKDRLNTIEGAESYEDFKNRIQNAFNKLITKNQNGCVATIWHGGPMRVLFRNILKLGELDKLGDFAWVELEKTDDGFKIINSKRMEFLF